MSQRCADCVYFDREAAKLGGKKVHMYAMAKCSYQLPPMPPLPERVSFFLQDNEMMCGAYGTNCKVFRRRSRA